MWIADQRFRWGRQKIVHDPDFLKKTLVILISKSYQAFSFCKLHRQQNYFLDRLNLGLRSKILWQQWAFFHHSPSFFWPFRLDNVILNSWIYDGREEQRLKGHKKLSYVLDFRLLTYVSNTKDSTNLSLLEFLI